MSSVPNPFKPAAPKVAKPAATTAPVAKEDNMRELMKKQILKDLEVTTDSIDKVIISNEELMKSIEEEIFNMTGKSSKEKSYRELNKKISARIKGSLKAAVRQALRSGVISVKDLVALGDKEFDDKLKSEVTIEVKKASNKPPKLPPNLVMIQTSIDLASSTENFADYYDKMKENQEGEIAKAAEGTEAGNSEVDQTASNDKTKPVYSEHLNDTTKHCTFKGLSLGGEANNDTTSEEINNKENEGAIPEQQPIINEAEPPKKDEDNLISKKSAPVAAKQPAKMTAIKPAPKETTKQPPTLTQPPKQQDSVQPTQDHILDQQKQDYDKSESQQATNFNNPSVNIKSNLLGSGKKKFGFSPPNNPVSIISRNNKIKHEPDDRANQTLDMELLSNKRDSNLNQSTMSSVNDNINSQSNQKSRALLQLQKLIQNNPIKQVSSTENEVQASKLSNPKVVPSKDVSQKLEIPDQHLPTSINQRDYSNFDVNKSLIMTESQENDNCNQPKSIMFASIQSNLQEKQSFKQENPEDTNSNVEARTKRIADQQQDFIIPNELQTELENLKESRVKLELELESEKRSSIIYKDEINRLREEIQKLKTSQSEVNYESFKIEKSQLDFKLHEYQQENQQLKKQLTSYNASLEFFKVKIEQMNDQLKSSQVLTSSQIPEFKERNIDNIFSIGSSIITNINKPVIKIMPNPLKSHQSAFIQTQQIPKSVINETNHKDFNPKHTESKINYGVSEDHTYDNKDIYSNRNDSDLPRPMKMPPKIALPHSLATSSPKMKIKDNKPKHTPFGNSNAASIFDDTNICSSMQPQQEPIKSHSEKGLNIVEPSSNENENIDNFTNFTNGNPNIVEEVGSENYLNMNGNTYDEAKDNQAIATDNIVSQDHPLLENDQYNAVNSKGSVNADIAKDFNNFSDDPREQQHTIATNNMTNSGISGYKQYNSVDNNMYINADSGATTAFFTSKQDNSESHNHLMENSHNAPVKINKTTEIKIQQKQQFSSNMFGEGIDPFEELLGSLEQQQPKDVKKQAPKAMVSRPGTNSSKPTFGSSNNLPKNQHVNLKSEADSFFETKPATNPTAVIPQHTLPKPIQPVSRQAPKNDVNVGKLNMFDSGDMDHEGKF